MCVCVTSLLHELIRLNVCLSLCCLCLHTCCMNCSVCVRLLHNRLAPMRGSKSIIPAAFTYHFTELYVQGKQCLSLHANEPVSRRLHKEAIHSDVVSQQHFESDIPDYKFIPGLRVPLHCHSLFPKLL